MNRTTKYISGLVLFVFVTTIFSCNLEDFNLDKLSEHHGVVPTLFAPICYGTFEVEDMITGPVADGFPIPSDSLPIVSISLKKTGANFRSNALDSVYLVTHFTNDTPVNIEFGLNFISASTGLPIGQTFHSGKIPAYAKDFRIQFNLGPVDQDNLMDSSDIKLSFNLSSPDAANPILYKEVKNTLFTIKISFYAPVYLWKISK